jgi:hypothetical protein
MDQYFSKFLSRFVDENPKVSKKFLENIIFCPKKPKFSSKNSIFPKRG